MSLILGGKYKLIKAAGEGGTANVYLAQEVSTGRKVAVKVLKKNHPDAENMVRRFEREARLIQRLSHPNVVGLVDFVRAREGVLLLTEWVDGVRLDVLMKRQTLSRADVLSLLRQLASALGAIHAMGVVHRDLKPENIVITRDQVLKLLDFGIARATELGANEFVTSHGMVAGTPAYLAPEQALGKPTDARTDVYIFGVLAYRLLGGRLPFEHASMVQVVRAQVHDRPPMLVAPGIPVAMVRLVMLCLEKDPVKRPQDGSALASAIEKALA